MTTTNTSQQSEPLSDLAYDWVTIIQHKSEALRAYMKYIRDAEQANSPQCVDLMRRIYEQDREHVREAMQHLSEVMRSGKMEQGRGMGAGQATQGREELQGGGRRMTGTAGMSQGQGEMGGRGVSPSQSSQGQQTGQGEPMAREMGPGGSEGMSSDTELGEQGRTQNVGSGPRSKRDETI